LSVLSFDQRRLSWNCAVLERRVPVRMRVRLPAVPVEVVPMLMVGVMAMLMDMLCR
jgi:hypothetical protein